MFLFLYHIIHTDKKIPRVDALRDEKFLYYTFRLILQYSLLPSPPFSTGSKSVDDKYHTRNCHNGKYHINAHNYFPFFLLVNTKPTNKEHNDIIIPNEYINICSFMLLNNDVMTTPVRTYLDTSSK